MSKDWDQDYNLVDHIDDLFTLWQPTDAFSWTWLKSAGGPQTYSLLDSDDEMLGHVYERHDRVTCWAPFRENRPRTARMGVA